MNEPRAKTVDVGALRNQIWRLEQALAKTDAEAARHAEIAHQRDQKNRELAKQLGELMAENDRLQKQSNKAACYFAALTEIANDVNLECRCGDDPYTDGVPCPRCFAEIIIDGQDATRAAAEQARADKEAKL